MKCKYCKEEMNGFTPSFLCCFNEKCPYLKIDSDTKKSNEGLRAYIHRK